MKNRLVEVGIWYTTDFRYPTEPTVVPVHPRS